MHAHPVWCCNVIYRYKFYQGYFIRPDLRCNRLHIISKSSGGVSHMIIPCSLLGMWRLLLIMFCHLGLAEIPSGRVSLVTEETNTGKTISEYLKRVDGIHFSRLRLTSWYLWRWNLFLPEAFSVKRWFDNFHQLECSPNHQCVTNHGHLVLQYMHLSLFNHNMVLQAAILLVCREYSTSCESYVTIPVMIPSAKSVVCSIFTSSFSIALARLEPWLRWYQMYHVTGTIYNSKPKRAVCPISGWQWLYPAYS